MCVIIYNPANAIPITNEELSEAWDCNPDGAGFAVQMNGKVHYKRGFMDKKEFINEVQKYIGTYNTLLHFRISTSSKINKLQCHPYERTHIEKLSGITNDSVICMNGIVSCYYNDRKQYNDTMNYIIDHQDYFKNINQHIIDMVGDVTGSKWFVMKPNSIFKTSDFIEYEGRWYSNRNHLYTYNLYKKYDKYYYDDPYDYCSYSYKPKTSIYYDDYDYDYDFGVDYDCYDYESYSEKTMRMKQRVLDKADELFSKTMIKKLKKLSDGDVWEDIQYFIKDYCLDKYNKCMYCEECFEELYTKEDIVNKLEESFGMVY